MVEVGSGAPRFGPFLDRHGSTRLRRLAGRAVGASLGPFLQEEGDLEVHPVAGDAAVLDRDVLVLDPAALHAAQGLGRAVYGGPDGVLEAPLGDGAYLRYRSHSHGVHLPFLLACLKGLLIPPRESANVPCSSAGPISGKNRPKAGPLFPVGHLRATRRSRATEKVVPPS